MRETINDWKKEWIETNGLTSELEVIIKTRPDENSLYEGSFAKIPAAFLGKKVVESGQIVASSDPERDGCYSLII